MKSLSAAFTQVVLSLAVLPEHLADVDEAEAGG
jgi:hypothetical protein